VLAFELERPRSLQEAISILEKFGSRAMPKAGGTDLLMWMKDRLVTPEVVVDLSLIPDLAGVNFSKDGLRIGAMATCTEVLEFTAVEDHFPALRDACLSHSDWLIRNRATVVGNVCSAVPSGDVMPALYCYDATIRIVGPRGERSIPINKFILGPRKKDMIAGEIVTHVFLPLPEGKSSGCYLKLGRRNALDLAQVGVACVAIDGKNGREYRLAYGAVAPTPVRAPMAEKALQGIKTPDDALLEKVSALAKEAVKPIADVRAGVEYRLAMVGELTKRAIETCVERLKEE